MGGNNECFEKFERNKYLKKHYPAVNTLVSSKQRFSGIRVLMELGE